MQYAPGLAARPPGVLNSQVCTMSDPKKPNNAKLGLILAGLAVFFFAMVFIKRIWM
jgi:hypothetical protein